MCQGQLPRDRARSSSIIIAMGHSLTLPYKHMYVGLSFFAIYFCPFQNQLEGARLGASHGFMPKQPPPPLEIIFFIMGKLVPHQEQKEEEESWGWMGCQI